jgi:uncharacterized protein involved in exopolysaccharide biosynthesis
MADEQFPRGSGEGGRNEPEVRLELTNSGVRQVWALYSQQQAGPPPGATTDDGLSLFLRDLPGLLWRGKWFLAACLAAAVCLGVFYIRTTTPLWSIGSLVLVERRALVLDQGTRLPSGENFLATQAEVMQSPLIVDAVLDSLSEGDGENEDGAEPAFFDVSATRVVGTNVLALSVRTTDPDRGVLLSRGILEAYRDYVADRDQGGHSDAVELLTKRERELEMELELARAEYEALRRRGESMGQGEEALQIQKAVLESQARYLVEAQARRVLLENQLAALKASTGPRPGTSSAATLLREQLSLAEVKRSELGQRFSLEHPEIRALDPHIEALRRQLAMISQEEPLALERELQAAQETERRLQQLYRIEFNKARRLDAHRLEEEKLYAEVERLSEAHEEALARLEDRELTVRSLSQGDMSVRMRVLEPPTRGKTPIWPQPVLVLGPCVLVGLLGGIGLTLIADRTRTRNREPAMARGVPTGRTEEPRPVSFETAELPGGLQAQWDVSPEP